MYKEIEEGERVRKTECEKVREREREGREGKKEA